MFRIHVHRQNADGPGGGHPLAGGACRATRVAAAQAATTRLARRTLVFLRKETTLIHQTVGQYQWVVPDETSRRVGRHPAWLHTLVRPEATAYVIDPTCSGAAAAAIRGPDYDGTLIHDGWSP
jgi:hypothetical protein